MRYMALKCSVCNQKSTFPKIEPNRILTSVAIALIGLVALGALRESHIVIQLLVLLIAFGCSFLLFYLAQHDNGLMPCDSDTHKILYLEPDAKVTINFSKYIKPYGVYGLKFKTETDDEKFKQAFSDGMVPVVFHPNQKGSLTYDVRIINKSAVPKELLEAGSKFLVEDADGIFIAKGTIEKSELDY